MSLKDIVNEITEALNNKLELSDLEPLSDKLSSAKKRIYENIKS